MIISEFVMMTPEQFGIQNRKVVMTAKSHLIEGLNNDPDKTNKTPISMNKNEDFYLIRTNAKLITAVAFVPCNVCICYWNCFMAWSISSISKSLIEYL
jgi:hypothetical protein